MLAGHDGAAQVDCRHPIERRLGQLVERLVATGDADPDVVVQDVDAAPALDCHRHRGGERRLAGDVGLEGDAFAAGVRGQRRGLLRRGKVAVHSKDLRSFLREAQHCRATIADPLAGALPGTDDDRDLPRKAHHACPVQAPPNRKTVGSRM
jgi:hypothetical protein